MIRQVESRRRGEVCSGGLGRGPSVRGVVCGAAYRVGRGCNLAVCGPAPLCGGYCPRAVSCGRPEPPLLLFRPVGIPDTQWCLYYWVQIVRCDDYCIFYIQR